MQRSASTVRLHPNKLVQRRHGESSDSRRQEAAPISLLHAMARYRKLGRVYRERLNGRSLFALAAQERSGQQVSTASEWRWGYAA
jgi:hypothetical protein